MKILVVGAGRWGSVLIKKFDQQLGASNVFIAEKDSSKWHQFEPASGIRCFEGYEEALVRVPGVDAVVMATQPKDHYVIAEEALYRGKHVLVEKPMAMDGRAARDLYRRAKDNGLTLQTDSTWEYEPQAMSVLHPEAAYRDMRFYWCNKKESAAEDPILWVNGPHPIALALAAHGGKPAQVELKLILHESCVFDLIWKTGKAHVMMTWGTKTKARVIENSFEGTDGQWDYASFDDRKVERVGDGSSQDPLDRMCTAFINRCQPGHAWQDERGVQVVETLEMIELALKK